MAREASLFDEAAGSAVRGYILLKKGGGNIPPAWIDRARESRVGRHKAVKQALQKGGVADVATLEDWELAYRKECFYYGIRALFELERKGKTKL